jgi:hypothetical protein
MSVSLQAAASVQDESKQAGELLLPQITPGAVKSRAKGKGRKKE